MSVEISDGPIYLTATSPNQLLLLIGAVIRVLPDYLGSYGYSISLNALLRVLNNYSQYTFWWDVPNPFDEVLAVELVSDTLFAKLNSGDTARFTQSVFVYLFFSIKYLHKMTK